MNLEVVCYIQYNTINDRTVWNYITDNDALLELMKFAGGGGGGVTAIGWKLYHICLNRP